ncbi:MAG: hypothetical protein U0X20_29795 [Caldilineaceae bacterium]
MSEPASTQAAETQQPWDQMAGEPDLWYGRFQVYLELGVTRTLKVAATEAGLQVSGGGTWSTASRRWHWRERARAWDVHQRDLLALSERNRRLALRSRRVERMEDYLDAVCEVLDAANMPAADEKLAREWLPQMRVFLRDLLVAERQEFERGDYDRDDPDARLTITADDLRAAQRGECGAFARKRSLACRGPAQTNPRFCHILRQCLATTGTLRAARCSSVSGPTAH